jgi:hypothetical protein
MNYGEQTRQTISSEYPSFATLFKRYRLRSEFDTYSKFSEALAERGFFFEISIFSRWQKGTRKPTNRQVILSMIDIFIDKDSIRTQEQANEFLASTGLEYLTEKETKKLFRQGS